MYRTDMYEGMLAETIVIHGAKEDVIHAYFARPLWSRRPDLLLSQGLTPNSRSSRRPLG